MTIDNWDPTSPYKKLAALYAGRIESGELQPSEQLPSEQAMIQEFGYARETVRRAIRLLREQGWVVTLPGIGTFVRPEGWNPEK